MPSDRHVLVRRSRTALAAALLAVVGAAAAGPVLAATAAETRCQEALERYGATLVEKELVSLRRCTATVFGCIQLQPGDAGCLAGAKELCARELAWLAGGEASGPPADFLGQAGPSCADVDLAGMLDAAALGHGLRSCTDFGITPATTSDVLRCVARQHACEVATTLGAAVPRAAELLAAGGVNAADVPCLAAGADGGGRGVGASGASAAGDRERPVGRHGAHAAPPRTGRRTVTTNARAATTCQEAIGWAGQWFLRDYLKFLRPCLDAAWACAPGDAACRAAANALCTTQLERIRGAEHSVFAALSDTVRASCGNTRTLPAADLLGVTGLGFSARSTACATLGVDALAGAADVAACVVAAHDCAAQRLAAREVPRIEDLLKNAGLDVTPFTCLAATPQVTATCGNGALEEGEACDPPGSFAGCAAGAWCAHDCTCGASHPPVLVVENEQWNVPEGGSVTVPVSASDPDGDAVTLAAGPALPGAQFTTTPGVAATGTLVVAPGFGTAGQYAVTFTARDANGMTDSRTVWIAVQHVGQAPQLTVDPSATVAEGAALTLLVHAFDPDGDPLAFTVAPDPLPANAIFVPATGTLSFTPDTTQAGAYDFTFTASDGTSTTAPATCHVTVTDVVSEEPGEPVGLTLDVDRPASPTLLRTARITGRVNAVTGDPPAPERARSALITGLGATEAEQGATLNVPLAGATCCGWATHFAAGVSAASFGDGVTVTALDVAGAAEAVATIVVGTGAAPGVRTVTVATGSETAVSTIAFLVRPGRARVHGTVVDADSKRPLAGARVSVAGTAIQALTAADGTFLVDGLPGGARELLTAAQDHLAVTFAVEAPVGTTTEAGALPLPPTVADPAQPASVTLFSVLGRGLTDLAGQPSVEAARDVVRDALLLVGGDEVGVLDAYGNQLNGNLAGPPLFSVTDAGVTLYAARMATQDSTTLLEVLGQLSFGYTWTGGAPPAVTQWLAALQREVDAAWAHPNEPGSAYWITLFNGAQTRLSPNPPQLAGETRLSKLQAYVAVTGFLGAYYRNRAAWPNGSSALGGAFTGAWARLVDRLPVKPAGPHWSTPDVVARGRAPRDASSALPDFESLLRSYYLDQSEDALVRARELLLLKFPGQGLEDLFAENPLGVKEALDRLIAISGGDEAVRNQLQRLTARDGSGTPEDINLWSLFEVEQGPLNGFCFGAEFLNTFQMWPKLLVRSWAPNAPYIVTARETTRTIGEFTVPAVRVTFRPTASANDAGSLYYRLWRIVRDRDAETFRDPGNKPKASMVLVGFGALASGATLAPKAVEDGSGRYAFELLLPPFGMNQYRMDVVRWVPQGGGTTEEDLQKAGPWMAGYLDDPVTVPVFAGLGTQHLHMGTYYLHGDRIDVSPLSNAAAVYVGGQGSGLAQYGRLDLAVDPADSAKVYVSIPGFRVDENPESRATGSILRFDTATGNATEYVRPGFMAPGQIGLALDEHGNLFTDNAASDASYGGRVFRFLGFRGAGDPPFTPAYPDGEAAPDKWFSGSVNYYSRMIQRAQPAAVQAMVMGPARRSETGEELYVVDLASGRIKTIAVHGPEQRNWDPWHVNGQDWAWTKPDTVPAPEARDQLSFGPTTDLAWEPQRRDLYLTCGARVVRTAGGENGSRSITAPATADGTAETIFQLPAGLAFCDAMGEQILFVADRAAGAIYRIPAADLPLAVPDDDAARRALANRYLFITGISHPGQLRITERGAAMVYTDDTGVRYQKFGFTGRATDAGGTPLVGALVTVTSAAGTQTTTSDADGYYTFLERTSEPVVHATVQHERARYVERVTLTGRCNATLRSTPCVIVTAPADGAVTTDGTVTVHGTILPRGTDFTGSGSVLEVNGADGAHTYPLTFTGQGNDFVVPGVALAGGDNTLLVRTPALPGFMAGGSLVSAVRRDAAPATTQAAAGVLLDDGSNPIARTALDVLVGAQVVASTTTDSCGFWTIRNLPLGTVTVRVAGQ